MAEVGKSFDKIGKAFFIGQEKHCRSFSMAKNHYHDAFEIYYILEGERYYFIKDRTYHIKKGDLVLIDMGELHRTLDTGRPAYERILVNFKEEFLRKILEDSPGLDLLACFRRGTGVLRLNLSQQETVRAILVKMAGEDLKRAEGSDILLKALLTELLVFVCRIPESSSDRNPVSGPIHSKIQEIVSYINEHYTEDISLASISRSFFISTCYLSRVFKRVTGFNFIEYLNNVRVREAGRLLCGTRLSISDVSEKTGFESLTHFGRVFKAITGVSPLKYRKIKGEAF